MIDKIKEFKKKYDIKKTPILQEIMFFHRIKDEDTICLSLEFLNVLEAEYSGNLKEEKASYKKSIQIRQILYNLPALDIIYNEPITSENKMEKIINLLEKKGIDVTHLKDMEFDDFYKIVNIFKKSSFYLDTNKRWSSKFIYPFNFDVLFFDLSNKDGFTIDRRFFTRGGEVLYLMISRAKNYEILKKLLIETYSQNERFTKLFNKLQSKTERTNPSYLGYLAKEKSEIFDMVVDDLITLFKRNIPLNDKFIYMSLINGFYFVHFLLNESMNYANKSLSKEKKVVYVIEVLNNKSDNVRKASKMSYKFNEKLILEALKSEFNKLDKKLYKDLNITDFSEIEKKAKRELIPSHRELLKPSLASDLNTNSYRYLISDLFLKTLVLINVEKKMLFYDFLDLLYNKYGFIFSNRHLKLKQSFSENDFIKNEKRFFNRLKALGLLENKSDGYAYVVNIFEEKL
jgi:hypothetical protein